MKKTIILTTIMASLVVGSAFASSVPVTDIQQGKSKVAAEYSFAQSVTGNGSGNDGYGVSLETGLSDKLALQYGYHRTNLEKSGDLKDHQVAAVYKLNDNFNAYGALTYVDQGKDSWGGQAGVIGHKQLTDKVNGFAKVGFGTNIKQTYQVGATYALKDDVGLNVYYGYDKYDVDNNKGSDKGLHAGVGYQF